MVMDMVGSTLNLSKLSRGIGEVKNNGHERIDVVLEPEDYFNLIDKADRHLQLPPLLSEDDDDSPRDADKSLSGHVREYNLPKTFTTRKGALLLFSEDFAHKLGDGGHRDKDEARTDVQTLASIDLKTVDDLTKSILSYGSTTDGINLHFIHNVTGVRRRMFRPGFSARRYLSRLTRSIDFNILDSLLAKGHVSEKSLYQTNSLLPSLRRRINDDVSYPPAPYRLLKTMLLAPGLLSGFTFYRLEKEVSDLTTVAEMDETVSGVTTRGRHTELYLVAGAGAGAGAGVGAGVGAGGSVRYSELTTEHKGDVLADLLTKTAISHALDRHQQQLDVASDSQPTTTENGDSTRQVKGQHRPMENGRLELNMEHALKTFIEIQVPPVQISFQSPTRERSMDDSHSASEVDRRLPMSGETENEAAVATETKLQRSDTLLTNVSSCRDDDDGDDDDDIAQRVVDATAHVDSVRLSFNTTPVIPPIAHLPTATAVPPTEHTPTAATLPFEDAMHSLPLLPSIEATNVQEPYGAVTAVRVQPATPLESSVRPNSPSDWPVVTATDEMVSEKQLAVQTIDGSAFKRVLSVQLSPQQELKKTTQVALDSLPGRSLPHGLRGNVLHAKPSLSSKSQASSRSRKGGSSMKGSVICAPDGKVVSIGGAILRHESEASESYQLDHLQDAMSEKAPPSEISEEEVWGHKVSRPRSDRGSMTYHKTKEPHASESAASTVQQPISEQLVASLTEHAHTIAKSILTQPGTGLDLTHDAQTAAHIWREPVAMSRSQSLQHLGPDAAIEEFMAGREGAKSVSPSLAEYKDLLRQTLASVVAQVSGEETNALALDATVSSQLLDSLINHQVAPGDIEIAQEDDGQSVIRMKSVTPRQLSHKEIISEMMGGVKEGHLYQQPKGKGEGQIGEPPTKSIPSERVTEGDVGEYDVIHYGEKVGEGGAAPSPLVGAGREGQLAPSGPTHAGLSSSHPSRAEGVSRERSQVSAAARSAGGGKTSGSEDEVVDTMAPPGGKGAEKGEGQASQRKNGSTAERGRKPVGRQTSDKAEKGKSSLSRTDSKEEFIVGAVKRDKELETLYGAVDLPPPPPSQTTKPEESKKPKKEPIPARKKAPVKKTLKAKKTKAASSKKESTKASPPDSGVEAAMATPLISVESDNTTATPASVPAGSTRSEVRFDEDDTEGGEPTPSSTPTDDMEFHIVRDEFPDSDTETESGRPPGKSWKSGKSGGKSGVASEIASDAERADTAESSDGASQVWSQESRAAKRAAQAAQRREQVAQRRREREEAVKREREEAERREGMEKELEEEQRRREEQRRLERQRREDDELAEERADHMKEQQAKTAQERAKRQKEEYQRRMEEMRRRQAEEEAERREQSEQRKKEAEEEARLEALRVSRMLDEEREEYERRKEIEAEERRIAEEVDRLRREAEAVATLDAARRLAAELSAQRAALALRLRFNRLLHLEGDGLDHTQGVSRAFVFSYYQLLQWLGLELPAFEHFKETHLRY